MSWMSFLALATKGPTALGAILALSLRSAPAQKMPGVVLRRMTTLALVSNRTASTAASSSSTRFLLNAFLA